MQTASIDNNSAQRRICKKTLSERVEAGLTAMIFIMVTVICLFALLYLSHSNKVATKGHVLKKLQDERVELIMQNEVLNMKIADLQSLRRLEQDPKIASMITAESPKFIRGDTAIAKN
ncbi:MAG: hypothetical protein N4A36_03260 [Candidatus Gracilibacteria bacterium]|jgi:hypothetical protein|nr:hypothetical protein [Candidatus Gracilibacteria bacterium]